LTKYVTKQRLALVRYLTAHPDEQLTVRQIAAALEAEHISVSAIYRNMSDLITEGRLKRINRDDSREAYYQYTDADGCRENLHLVCKYCGKTVHMGSSDTQELVDRIASQKHFQIDRAETVLYGICESCEPETEEHKHVEPKSAAAVVCACGHVHGGARR